MDEHLAQMIRDLENLAASEEVHLVVRGTWEEIYASLRVGDGPEFEVIEGEDIISALTDLLHQLQEWRKCRGRG